MVKFRREEFKRFNEWRDSLSKDECANPFELAERAWMARASLEVIESKYLEGISDNTIARQIATVDVMELPRDKLIAIHDIVTSDTTKYCPKCLSTALARFSSTNTKRCPQCLIDIDWFVTKGQKCL